jgi:hypothetical protein
MTLRSGKYLARVEREVIVWPAPDANGTGPRVDVPELDGAGRQIGRRFQKDVFGKEVREYPPPEGFREIRNWEGVPTYALYDERDGLVRQPNGESVTISPGQAIAINPDGSVELLPDDWSQYVFEQRHDIVSDSPDDAKTAVASDDVVASPVSVEPVDDELARLEARLAELKAVKG